MVQLYILNPVQKLRLLARMWFRGSKPSLLDVDASPLASVQEPNLNAPARISEEGSYRRPAKLPAQAQDFLPLNQDFTPRHDPDYYPSDAEGRFCTFLVGDTLFRVHRCYLLREPSVFADMLNLPQPRDLLDGASDATAIRLSDTADQFRDLLWALYSPPSRLCLYIKSNREVLSVERLLNIAELSIKYCITSYEDWAIERIYQLAQEPASFLRSSPATQCARVLNVAVLSEHKKLRKVVEKRLISRILWADLDSLAPILEVAEHHGLRRMKGVAYYRELISLDDSRSSEDSRQTPLGCLRNSPDLSSISDPVQRKAMRSAHLALSTVCQNLPRNIPKFDGRSCPLHDQCLKEWSKAWRDAALEVEEEYRSSTADVLGRLRATMVLLRKTLPELNGMSVSCTLAALEAIDAMRDGMVDGLVDYFRVD